MYDSNLDWANYLINRWRVSPIGRPIIAHANNPLPTVNAVAGPQHAVSGGVDTSFAMYNELTTYNMRKGVQQVLG
jgi:hypothetical protein